MTNCTNSSQQSLSSEFMDGSRHVELNEIDGEPRISASSADFINSSAVVINSTNSSQQALSSEFMDGSRHEEFNEIDGEARISASSADFNDLPASLDESHSACFPEHPKDAFMKPRMFTRSENEELRTWLRKHGPDSNGLVQQTLWRHFGTSPVRSRSLGNDLSLEDSSALEVSSKHRSFVFTPFAPAFSTLSVKIRELGANVCIDVVAAGGIPCMVAIIVEFDGGGSWCRHSDLSYVDISMLGDEDVGALQGLVCDELACLEVMLRDSMRILRTHRRLSNITRLFIRLFYRILPTFPSAERCVRRRHA